MRRKFLTFITAILATIISMSSLVGCNLIVTNSERDMNQVVATVQIENAPLEEIYKRDMISAYLNYGYSYEQYYGYSRGKVFTMIIDNLVQNRVYVQNAMLEFDKADGEGEFGITLNKAKDKWDIDRYLTAPEITYAEYTAKLNINDLITAYEDVEEEAEKETLTEEVRTTPKDAQNAEKEDPSEEEQKAYEIKVDTASRKKAYNKVINLLQANNLLGEYDGDIKKTQYFKDLVVSNKETKLMEKYENCIRKSVLSTITFNQIRDLYVNKYEQQLEWSNAEFVSALSSATASDPILVSNGSGYGFVYNLLLGASEEQTNAINNIDKKLSIKEKAERRAVILQETKVKDLRSSWILSGYDFDGSKFTGDYTFVSGDSLEFKGSVEKIKDATEDAPAEYKINSVDEFNLDEFIDMMETYVYGGKQEAEENDNASVYKKVNTTKALDEYDERINELLFAFSTDPGSLNTYKGYAIKPIPDGSNSEDYMQEFADAGRKLLAMGDKSYIMVATDYGYHVMFYSQMFDNYNYADLDSYLDSFDSEKDWEKEFKEMMADFIDYEDTDSYLYLLTNSLASTKVTNRISQKQREIINTYVYDEETCRVTWYKDRYADLATHEHVEEDHSGHNH